MLFISLTLRWRAHRNGARHDPDGYLFWRRRDLPATLAPFVDEDCAIEIEFLLDPETDACKAAIALTATAAVTADVPVTRLSLVEPAAGRRPAP